MVARVRRLVLIAVLHGLALADGRALTEFELLTDPGLTPRRFAAKFEHFIYEFAPEVQVPEIFLQRERGDCDDYAILADHVLKKRGYVTRIIHIRLVGRVAHAVCYVEESKAFLDFNNRKYFMNLERSGRSLREIATEVADSFKANWTSASEFTYDYREGKKNFTRTVVKTDPPGQDSDAGAD
jgi:hypothetical protein